MEQYGLNRERHYGAGHYNARLTDEAVLDIYLSPETQAEVAERYCISQALVSNIRSGKRWTYIPRPEIPAWVIEERQRRVNLAHSGEQSATGTLTEHDVIDIIKRLATGKWGIISELAREYNTTHSTIQQIRDRKSWAHIWDHPELVGITLSETKKKPLNEADVIDILKRSAAGDSQSEIARDYGVSSQSINQIVRRKAWSWVSIEGLDNEYLTQPKPLPVSVKPVISQSGAAWATYAASVPVDSDSERWVPVAGYEGLYEVSNLGNIRSLRILTLHKDGETILMEEGLLHPSLDRDGYPNILLCKDGQERRQLVHRLVMRSFVGPRQEGEVIRHKNGFRLDNRLDNLVYGTAKENGEDRAKHRTARSGEQHPMAELTEAQVRDIIIRGSTRKRGIVSQLAREYNISYPMVANILNGKNWRNIEVEGITRENLSKPRITEDTARQIKKRGLAGESQRSLAREFNVSQQLVSLIVRGKAWSHVTVE